MQILGSFTEVNVIDGVTSVWVWFWCVGRRRLVGSGGQHGALIGFSEPKDAVLSNNGLVWAEIADLSQEWFIGLDNRDSPCNCDGLVPTEADVGGDGH